MGEKVLWWGGTAAGRQQSVRFVSLHWFMAASFVASTFGQLRAGSRILLLLLLLLVSPLVGGAVNIWLTALLNTLLPLIMQQQWQLQRQMAAASAMRFLSAQDKAASILSLLLSSLSHSHLHSFSFPSLLPLPSLFFNSFLSSSPFRSPAPPKN